MGDPGLLASELVAVEPNRYDLGVVPHWSDTKLAERFSRYNPLVIYPTQHPLEVIRQIGSCRKIVSSSLHGIVVADSFGIPRRAEIFSQATREGGKFKFLDYSTVIGLDMRFGTLQSPPRWKIEEIQEELFEMFRYIKEISGEEFDKRT